MSLYQYQCKSCYQIVIKSFKIYKCPHCNATSLKLLKVTADTNGKVTAQNTTITDNPFCGSGASHTPTLPSSLWTSSPPMDSFRGNAHMGSTTIYKDEYGRITRIDHGPPVCYNAPATTFTEVNMNSKLCNSYGRGIDPRLAMAAFFLGGYNM